MLYYHPFAGGFAVLEALLWSVYCLYLLWVTRSIFVDRARMRAVDAMIIHAVRDALNGTIKPGEYEITVNLDKYQTRKQMIFDLTKWTFKQFYPDL